MNKYTVVVHFEGAIDFHIKAKNSNEAKELAMAKFRCMPSGDIIDALADYDICDCWAEVPEKENSKQQP